MGAAVSEDRDVALVLDGLFAILFLLALAALGPRPAAQPARPAPVVAYCHSNATGVGAPCKDTFGQWDI